MQIFLIFELGFLGAKPNALKSTIYIRKVNFRAHAIKHHFKMTLRDTY